MYVSRINVAGTQPRDERPACSCRSLGSSEPVNVKCHATPRRTVASCSAFGAGQLAGNCCGVGVPQFHSGQAIMSTVRLGKRLLLVVRMPVRLFAVLTLLVAAAAPARADEVAEALQLKR